VSQAENHESDLQGIAIRRRAFRQNRLLPSGRFSFQINGFGILHGRRDKAGVTEKPQGRKK
jgi:hypothetical protein